MKAVKVTEAQLIGKYFYRNKDCSVSRIEIIQPGKKSCVHYIVIDWDFIGRCRCGLVVNYSPAKAKPITPLKQISKSKGWR